MKEMEHDANKWKESLYSQTGSIDVVKTSMMAKEVRHFNEILRKIPVLFIAEKEKPPQFNRELEKTLKI